MASVVYTCVGFNCFGKSNRTLCQTFGVVIGRLSSRVPRALPLDRPRPAGRPPGAPAFPGPSPWVTHVPAGPPPGSPVSAHHLAGPEPSWAKTGGRSASEGHRFPPSHSALPGTITHTSTNTRTTNVRGWRPVESLSPTHLTSSLPARGEHRASVRRGQRRDSENQEIVIFDGDLGWRCQSDAPRGSRRWLGERDQELV